MSSRDQLIASLVDDLKVKRNRLPVVWVAISWWLLSWLYVVVATWLMGPIRALHEQYAFAPYVNNVHTHQFHFESLIGLVASLLIAIVAWYGSTPAALTKRAVYIAFAFVAVWLAFYVVGFFEPALEPSMIGKREHCYFEAFLYSMPPTLLACFYMLRRYPINKIKTGFLIGLAGGMMPALFMQFACMYEPGHIFTHHIIPALFTGFIGAFILYVGGLIKKR
ncbi:MAG: NrsF family protein [Cellvibrionaceae bacterium]